jgi:hypothetical protein
MYANGSDNASLIDEVRTVGLLVAELASRVKTKPPAVGIDPDASVNRIAKALKRGMSQRRFRWLITAMSELDRADRVAARKACRSATKRWVAGSQASDHLRDQIPAGHGD